MLLSMIVKLPSTWSTGPTQPTTSRAAAMMHADSSASTDHCGRGWLTHTLLPLRSTSVPTAHSWLTTKSRTPARGAMAVELMADDHSWLCRCSAHWQPRLTHRTRAAPYLHRALSLTLALSHQRDQSATATAPAPAPPAPARAAAACCCRRGAAVQSEAPALSAPAWQRAMGVVAAPAGASRTAAPAEASRAVVQSTSESRSLHSAYSCTVASAYTASCLGQTPAAALAMARRTAAAATGFGRTTVRRAPRLQYRAKAYWSQLIHLGQLGPFTRPGRSRSGRRSARECAQQLEAHWRYTGP